MTSEERAVEFITGMYSTRIYRKRMVEMLEAHAKEQRETIRVKFENSDIAAKLSLHYVGKIRVLILNATGESE